MDTTAEVLLIIVSSVLAVFLVVLSIALIFIIRFLKRADDVANSVESAADAVKKSAAAMPLVRLLTNIFVRKRSGRG